MGFQALILPLFLVVLVSRKFSGSWLHPGTILTAAWTGLYAVAALAFSSEIGWFSALTCLGVALSGLLISPVTVRLTPSEFKSVRISHVQAVRTFAVVGGVAFVLAAVLTARANGLILPVTTSFIAGILEQARELTVRRYTANLITPPVATFLLAVGYAASLVAAWIPRHPRRNLSRLAPMLPVAGAAMYSLATTARTVFILSLFLWLASWIVHRITSEAFGWKLSSRDLAALSVGAGALVAVFVAGAATRMMGGSTITLSPILQAIAVYVAGGIPAYGAWMDGGADLAPSFGVEVFAGVTAFFFNPETAQPYTVFIEVGDGATTNIYTALRPLIQDFGLVGAFLVILTSGLLAALAFQRLCAGWHPVAAPYLIGWLFFLFFSLNTSVYTWTNVVVGFTLGSFSLILVASESKDGNSYASGETKPRSSVRQNGVRNDN